MAGNGFCMGRRGLWPFLSPQSICKTSVSSEPWNLALAVPSILRTIQLDQREPSPGNKSCPQAAGEGRVCKGRVFTGQGPKERSSIPRTGAQWKGVGGCGAGGNVAPKVWGASRAAQKVSTRNTESKAYDGCPPTFMASKR